MPKEQITRYGDSFYIEMRFASGEVRYLDPHAKVIDAPHLTSLVACYKAILRMASKHRQNPIVLYDDTKPFEGLPINDSAYENLAKATIVMRRDGVDEPVRKYYLVKCKVSFYPCLDENYKPVIKE